ncbi:MAG TPA: hypothetical protein VGS22_19100 [Thermoanaerobaculia bacterium]|jgi:tetratricopeptide (TPR) repeat protein|nr:hypothetical protein [Thermoanaerobaculia bacterium]
MDAPDAPLDSHAAPGAVDARLRLVAKAAPPTPCVPREVVERMAAETFSTEEIRGAARRLVRHLLRGCPDCAITFGQVAGLPAVTGTPPLFHYEVPVDRGILRALRDGRNGDAGAVDHGKTFERELAAALLEEARKLRRDDPQTGLELLDEALREMPAAGAFCADGEAPGDDLACEIHAERANLLRLLGRHPEAEQAFQAALGAWQEGARSAEALLHLGDLYGSFLIARRRFAEADRLLARLVTFERRGDLAPAGKLALQRSHSAAYSGDPDKASRLACDALRLLGGSEGPEMLELRLAAAQHVAVLYVALNLFQDASDCAEAIRTQYHRHMGDNNRARFLWLDAQIYDGLGRRGLAEGLFRRAKAQFEQLGLPFQAALVGLDLGLRLVERGRAREARALIAKELIPTFRAVGVAREGLASLVLLERATEAAALDAALLKSVLRDLERAGQAQRPARREGDSEAEISDFD